MTTIAREADQRLVAWLATCPRHVHALDVGCGVGTYAAHIPADRVTGVDAFSAYVEEARPKYLSVLFADARSLSQKMLATYDLAVLVDAIEHFKKKDGTALLKTLQKAVKTILVFTPDGMIENETVDGNPFNAHLSGWSAAELEALGFKATIVDGYHADKGFGAIFAHWEKPA